MVTFKAMSLPEPSEIDFPEQKNIADPSPPLTEFPELKAVNQADLSALACKFQGPLDEAEVPRLRVEKSIHFKFSNLHCCKLEFYKLKQTQQLLLHCYMM